MLTVEVVLSIVGLGCMCIALRIRLFLVDLCNPILLCNPISSLERRFSLIFLTGHSA